MICQRPLVLCQVSKLPTLEEKERSPASETLFCWTFSEMSWVLRSA